MNLSLAIKSLKQSYEQHTLTPRELVTQLIERVEQLQQQAIFITPPSIDWIAPYIEQLEQQSPATLPLYGIPFVVKDNIDVAGLPTTAACPAYSYVPKDHATAVKRLIDAGAIPIGKANLDQFATGLIGTRSPYGAVENALNPALISGGSSSGSAVSVALDIATFALGTDTAGSGRVPAALNNLYGLKPSLGAWPVKGVVPACESLDCVTVFAKTLDDVYAVDAVVRGEDDADCWSIDLPLQSTQLPNNICLPSNPLTFFGPYAEAYEAAWKRTVEALKQQPIDITYVDTTYLQQAAAILYEGPWIAERFAAVGDFVEANPSKVFDVTRQLLKESDQTPKSATDLFKAQHTLQRLKKKMQQQLAGAVLVLPTTGGTWTLEQAFADPLKTNAQLGIYTNHCNLLNMAAIAVPAGFAETNVPFGITLFSRHDEEHLLKGVAELLQQETVQVAVCGLHMRDFPLMHQMTSCGATYAYTATTTQNYRLYELATTPKKPGLVKSSEGGEIEVEVWDMPVATLGKFLTYIPSPLGLGKVSLSNGVEVIGFICEPSALDGAYDVTDTGGWRYIESLTT